MNQAYALIIPNMSTPNVSKTKWKEERLLLQCDCVGNHYLEATMWPDDNSITLSFVEPSPNLWQTLKVWWYHKDLFINSTIIDKEDRKRLIKLLKAPIIEKDDLK